MSSASLTQTGFAHSDRLRSLRPATLTQTGYAHSDRLSKSIGVNV